MLLYTNHRLRLQCAGFRLCALHRVALRLSKPRVHALHAFQTPDEIQTLTCLNFYAFQHLKYLEEMLQGLYA